MIRRGASDCVVDDADALAPVIDPHVKATIGALLRYGRVAGKHCAAIMMHEKLERSEQFCSRRVRTQAQGKGPWNIAGR
jgi:hypothetical protein